MGKYAIVIGDITSHGGEVISASSTFDCNGKKAALLHDTVSCPLHGTNLIIEADSSVYEEDNRGIVLHGCQTHCGATVIAGCKDMEVE